MSTCTDDFARVIALAECIERECASGRPVAGLLDELRRRLVDTSTDPRHDAQFVDVCRRLVSVVERVARDVASDHVRSISGLSAQARRLAEHARRVSEGGGPIVTGPTFATI